MVVNGGLRARGLVRARAPGDRQAILRELRREASEEEESDESEDESEDEEDEGDDGEEELAEIDDVVRGNGYERLGLGQGVRRGDIEERPLMELHMVRRIFNTDAPTQNQIDWATKRFNQE